MAGGLSICRTAGWGERIVRPPTAADGADLDIGHGDSHEHVLAVVRPHHTKLLAHCCARRHEKHSRFHEYHAV